MVDRGLAGRDGRGCRPPLARANGRSDDYRRAWPASPIPLLPPVIRIFLPASPTKPSPLPVRESTKVPSVPPTASVTPSAATRHYLVADTVGNCSVIDSKPSDGLKGV